MPAFFVLYSFQTSPSVLRTVGVLTLHEAVFLRVTIVQRFD